MEIIRTTRKKRPNTVQPQNSAMSADVSNVAVPDAERKIEEQSQHAASNLPLPTVEISNNNNGNLRENLEGDAKNGALVSGKRRNAEEDSDSDSAEMGATPNDNSFAKISALLKGNIVAEENENEEGDATVADQSNNSSKNLAAPDFNKTSITIENPHPEQNSNVSLENGNAISEPAIETSSASITDDSQGIPSCTPDQILAELVSEVDSGKCGVESVALEVSSFTDFGDGSIVSVNSSGPADGADQATSVASATEVESAPPSVGSSGGISNESGSSSADPTTPTKRRPLPHSSPVRNTLSGNLDTIKILKFNYHVNASFYMIQDLARISMVSLPLLCLLF